MALKEIAEPCAVMPAISIHNLAFAFDGAPAAPCATSLLTFFRESLW